MGSTWDGAGIDNYPSPRREGRPFLVSILVRDYLPRQPWWRRWWNRLLHVLRIRRIRPLWTPFAESGKLRDDLLAGEMVDGQWVPNPKPNDGFYPLGTIRGDDER